MTTEPAARIFVVEDEALIAMELKLRLNQLGYAICGGAARGETAIEEIAAVKPDLVLMDINLAGKLNGIETALRLRERVDVPVVYLTAYSDETFVAKAVASGSFGYLIKPFQPNELHTTIQTALYKHRIERELREANARLEQRTAEAETARANLVDAIESIQHAIALYDKDERLVLFNRRFVEEFPEIRDVAVPGARAEDIARAIVGRGVADPQPVQTAEERVAKRMADFRRASGESNIVRTNDGRIMQLMDRRARSGGVVVVRLDVTDQFKAEERLREAQRMEAIGKLTGGMAHDFNNYLGIIIGNLDLLGGHVDSAGKTFLNAALKGAESSAQLTRSLLAFSRQQPLSPRRVDVGRSLNAVAALLWRTLGEDIALTVTVGPDVWPVRIDGSQLDSCIVNLANNARDAMPRGGPLAISARNVHVDDLQAAEIRDAAPGDFVLIEVSDTGSGMPPEAVARAFEPFFSTKPVGHGTGLGLSMVYGFVKQSGGWVYIDSEVGRGTTVRLYLPRDRDSDNATTDASGPKPEAAGGNETILLVEDNATMRETTAQQLTSLGYRTIEAENGEAALDILKQRDRRIDLLFTDVVMPGRMNGYELVEIARRARPGIKALVTSGFSGVHVEGVDLLVKPYRLADLARAIRGVLDGMPGEAGGRA